MVLTGATCGQDIDGRANSAATATLIDQKLGASISRDAQFLDSTGKAVKIGDYFTGQRPVILNLQYFRCPSLCGPITNGLTNALEAIPMTAGREFDIVTVSFDHREGPELGAEKKQSVLEAFASAPDKQQGGRSNWHFLTGDQTNIRQLTNSVGYGFQWNETKQDYDHRAAIIFLSPDGKIIRYLRGAYYEPSTFRLAIVESSGGKVGTALDRFLLSCYCYNPRTGTYSRIGPMVMALGGALTFAALLALLFVLVRKQRHPQVAPATTHCLT